VLAPVPTSIIDALTNDVTNNTANKHTKRFIFFTFLLKLRFFFDKLHLQIDFTSLGDLSHNLPPINLFQALLREGR
jgi:hypothetical protein